MSNEENNRPAPSSEPGGSSSNSSDYSPSGRGPRRRRTPHGDEGGRRSSPPRNDGGSEYKPSEGSNREPAGRGERDERSERGERGGSSRDRRGRPGDRRSGPGGDRGDRRGGRPEGRGGGRSDNRPAPKKEPATSAPVAAAAESAKPAGYLEELGGTLLESVSRSFSLTIKALPPALRAPISAGYLLARALDTIADTTAVPAEKRLEHLRALLEMIKYGVDSELLPPLQKDLASRQSHAGEQALIKKLDRCLGWLNSLPAEDQWDLRRTLFRIGRGQELDILRFGEGNAARPKALADEKELDEYTYFVAGCVGELWTKLCARHLPAGWSRLAVDEMLKLGKRFGQGLQMVNILRDLPADLEAGRCYLPQTLLANEDLDAASLAEKPERARPILSALRRETVAQLDDAWKYARSLNQLKLRFACALPVLIGFETLGLLAKTSPLESSERIKVSKTGVRGLMLSSAVGSAVGAWNERLYRRTRERASAGL